MQFLEKFLKSIAVKYIQFATPKGFYKYLFCSAFIHNESSPDHSSKKNYYDDNHKL